MLAEIYYLICNLIKIDSYFHIAKRAISVTQITGNFGLALLEYGKQRSEVIWPRNTPPNYIEEIIKLDGNFFNKPPSRKQESRLL